MGAVGTSNNTSSNSYKYGNATYSVTKSDDGKTYYLHSDYVGTNAQLHQKWKIAYANNDEKARVYIPELKEYIYFNSDPNMLKILQNVRGKK